MIIAASKNGSGNKEKDSIYNVIGIFGFIIVLVGVPTCVDAIF